MTVENLTVRDEEYRWPMRVVNATARAAELCGLPLGKLEQQSILRAARRSTGLSVLGDEDFLVPMERAIDAGRNAPTTAVARVVLRQAFVRAVVNRLRFQEYIAAHAGILDNPVKRPVFVLGFPRTGTTLLQNLLSMHPERRSLKFWELVSPIPVHADRQTDRARRIRTAERILGAAYRFAPEMAEVHYINATTAEECWPLFGPSFSVLNWDLQSGLRSYGSWLLEEHDMVGAYGEYADFLRLLLHQDPASNLVLKCPEHLWFVDALLEVFPDACIVWTHRDPVASVASYCSLISMQWRTLYGGYDPRRLGLHISDRFLQGIERAMAARSRARPGTFFDVNFHELIVDPAAMVEQICDHFDLPVEADMHAQVSRFIDGREEDRAGKHKYSADRYGLDRRDIHRRYARYIETFAVKVKAA